MKILRKILLYASSVTLMFLYGGCVKKNGNQNVNNDIQNQIDELRDSMEMIEDVYGPPVPDIDDYDDEFEYDAEDVAEDMADALDDDIEVEEGDK